MAEPEYTTFKLDNSGDWAVPVQLLKGREAVAQRLRNRFRFFKQEWFLDRRKGTPYYERILVKSPDLRLVRALFRDIILRTPGIQRITKFNVSFDRKTRSYSTDFEAQMSDGSIFRSQPEEFIIRYPV